MISTADFCAYIRFLKEIEKNMTGVIPFGKNNILEGTLLVIPSRERRKFAALQKTLQNYKIDNF